ncbi:hypothetical protein scyTo_0002827 [Scyliorhinus torazame]|uniref:Uncharacterized protein n=1 Tax=Scyliorhinus torazame TaxID=75743 RepID=A0A401PKT8_SCYTO|nr:hypothetical protein [Scyliorhinus torazame]
MLQGGETKDEELTEDADECFDKNEGQKYTEKSSEDVRNAFTGSLCKFRTMEEQEIEAHLEMPGRKETLEVIGKFVHAVWEKAC